jgi:hypothetical protein
MRSLYKERNWKHEVTKINQNAREREAVPEEGADEK